MDRSQLGQGRYAAGAGNKALIERGVASTLRSGNPKGLSKPGRQVISESANRCELTWNDAVEPLTEQSDTGHGHQ